MTDSVQIPTTIFSKTGKRIGFFRGGTEYLVVSIHSGKKDREKYEKIVSLIKKLFSCKKIKIVSLSKSDNVRNYRLKKTGAYA